MGAIPTPEETAANKQRFLEQLLDKYGNATAAAKATGISRETARLWRKDDPAFDALYEEALEDVKDNVESQLLLIGTGAKRGTPSRSWAG